MRPGMIKGEEPTGWRGGRGQSRQRAGKQELFMAGVLKGLRETGCSNTNPGSCWLTHYLTPYLRAALAR